MVTESEQKGWAKFGIVGKPKTEEAGGSDGKQGGSASTSKGEGSDRRGSEETCPPLAGKKEEKKEGAASTKASVTLPTSLANSPPKTKVTWISPQVMVHSLARGMKAPPKVDNTAKGAPSAPATTDTKNKKAAARDNALPEVRTPSRSVMLIVWLQFRLLQLLCCIINLVLLASQKSNFVFDRLFSGWIWVIWVARSKCMSSL